MKNEKDVLVSDHGTFCPEILPCTDWFLSMNSTFPFSLDSWTGPTFYSFSKKVVWTDPISASLRSNSRGTAASGSIVYVELKVQKGARRP